MSTLPVPALVELFASRLDTLEHLLQSGRDHFRDDGFLQRRLIADMLPLGTQVAFTCNQPRNFALWMQGKPPSDLDPAVATLEAALKIVRDTKQLLAEAGAANAALPDAIRLGLGPGLHADLTGQQYVQDFLVPNFYFHLVTAYGILRMAGVNVGKRDYMRHLLPLVRQGA